MNFYQLNWRKGISALFCALLINAAVFAQQSDLERAANAYNAGDYATAIALFEPNARQGNREAQFAMGVAYYKGHGVDQDLAEALAWFRKAADSGQPTAMFNLGVAYWQGAGVQKNFATAVDWWERAAELSDVASQYNLGFAYYQGQGAEKDLEKASDWLGKAAAQGHADAQRLLDMISDQQIAAQTTSESQTISQTPSKQPSTTGINSASVTKTESNAILVSVRFGAGKISYDNLPIRSGPNASAIVTGKLRQGTPVKILQTTGSWSRIETPSPPRFWVFGRYVTGAPQGRISADKVRLRTKPTTGSGSSIVTELNKGDVVKVHASSGDWKQVSTEPAIQSWVQSSGLAEQNPVTQSWLDNFNAQAASASSSRSSVSTSPTPTAAQAFKAAWVTSQEAPILGRPDENAALLNYVKKDTPIKTLGSKGSWLMVQVPGGLDVWIYGEFVSEDGADAQINNNRVRIRSLPSSAPESDILGLLDKGASIKVISRKGDWIRARVLYSVAGWIRKGDTTTPGNVSAGWQSSWDAMRSSAQN